MALILDQAAFVARIGAAEADTIAGTGGRRDRALDTGLIEGALIFADQLIRGKVAARVPVLPDPAPELLRGFAQDIALYRLRYKEGDQSGVGEETRLRYNAALKQLDAIAAGSLELDPTHPDGNSAAIRTSPGEPARAPGLLEGYR